MDEGLMDCQLDQEGLQALLDAFLLHTSTDVVLWLDRQRCYEERLEEVLLPADIMLVQESRVQRCDIAAIKQWVSKGGRLLVYQQSGKGLLASDELAEIAEQVVWFSTGCALCASDESFVAAAAASGASNLPDSSAGKSERRLAAQEKPAILQPASKPLSKLDQKFKNAAEKMTEDWYTHVEFVCAVVDKVPESCGMPVAKSAEKLGYRAYDDCVIRSSYATPGDYYDTLFQVSSLIKKDSISGKISKTKSFRDYLAESLKAGRLFLFDDESWITEKGLDDLGVDAATIADFVSGVVQGLREHDLSVFTVRSLASLFPELRLFKFDPSDAFLESVLQAHEDVFVWVPCNVTDKEFCIYGEKGIAPSLEHVARQAITIMGPSRFEDFQGELAEVYGIELQGTKLQRLITSSGLYSSKKFDLVCISKDAYIKSLEDDD